MQHFLVQPQAAACPGARFPWLQQSLRGLGHLQPSVETQHPATAACRWWEAAPLLPLPLPSPTSRVFGIYRFFSMDTYAGTLVKIHRRTSIFICGAAKPVQPPS